jgi:ribonuclease VapC
MTVVIDSSALLAALLEENGAEMAEEALLNAMMSTVNLAECVEAVERRGLKWDAVAGVLQLTTLDIVPLVVSDAVAAGQLAGLTRPAGLSLGDRCCLALAKSRQLPILTADRAWLPFAKPLGIEIRLIR